MAGTFSGACPLRATLEFRITRGKIVEIDLVADSERLQQLDLTILND